MTFLNDCRQSNDGTGGPVMKSNREATKTHPIEEVGTELRSKDEIPKFTEISR